MTVLAPDWDNIPGVTDLLTSWHKSTSMFRGHKIEFSDLYNSGAIWLDDDLKALPEQLRDVPMLAIHLIVRNVSTLLHSGTYREGPYFARVVDGDSDNALVKHIEVKGVNGMSLSYVQQWRNELMVDRKEYCHVSPHIHEVNPRGNDRLVLL